MTDKSTSDQLAELTHRFHEKYRASGIALCISLATVASAEGWWFYGLLNEIKNTDNCFQIFSWIIVIFSAISLFVSSFILQFFHYHGMKRMAQSFCHAYKFSTDQNDENSKKNMDNEWTSATIFFAKSDKVVIWLKVFTIVNFSSALFYIVLYQPSPRKVGVA